MARELPLFNRDLSWLSFNQRILEEAAKKDVPLLERIRFMAIYSSNLDEFYRVRMPVLTAIKKITQDHSVPAPDTANVYMPAKKQILKNQARYGRILKEQIIPALENQDVHWIYQKPLPDAVLRPACDYFFSELAAYLEISHLHAGTDFFPINNRIYCVLTFQGQSVPAIIHVPEQVERFYKVRKGTARYILFIDDIIRKNLSLVFPGKRLTGMYTFKVSRDADLDFSEGFRGDLAQQIEEKIRKRDFGLATRLQYQPGMPEGILQQIMEACQLRKSNVIEGGDYHNMKDLFRFPVTYPSGWYPRQNPLPSVLDQQTSLFTQLQAADLLISTPYESYRPVLRFFNEAAIEDSVEEIYTTIYRVARDSKVLQALMSAAKNGKKVTVFVELRARFDEANNIKWARQLQRAGVNVLYSFADIKVHAKVALVKARVSGKVKHFALFSTGNLNEQTSEVYADHILLTAQHKMTGELLDLFQYLMKRKETSILPEPVFNTLLVAPFNLGSTFHEKIDREITHARQGSAAEIIVKLNNLEEESLIGKLYEAHQAGVRVKLIVRSICRLVPQVPGFSAGLPVRRIVDRYLEHSRIILFHNQGEEELWMGSADWMYRNIYHRIEVCFPINNPQLRASVKHQLELQLRDDQSAVYLGRDLENIPVPADSGIRAQSETYQFLQGQRNT